MFCGLHFFPFSFILFKISEAQREVISSLLTEASDYWADNVAHATNKSIDEVVFVLKIHQKNFSTNYRI